MATIQVDAARHKQIPVPAFHDFPARENNGEISALRLGEVIANARKKQGWSQQRLAVEAFVPIELIVALEAAQDRGILEMIGRIADKLSIDAGAVLNTLIGNGSEADNSTPWYCD